MDGSATPQPNRPCLAAVPKSTPSYSPTEQLCLEGPPAAPKALASTVRPEVEALADNSTDRQVPVPRNRAADPEPKVPTATPPDPRDSPIVDLERELYLELRRLLLKLRPTMQEKS